MSAGEDDFDDGLEEEAEAEAAVVVAALGTGGLVAGRGMVRGCSFNFE